MPGKFWVFQPEEEDQGAFRWTFIAPNGRTVADSAIAFPSVKDAVANLSEFRRCVAKALVVEPEGERIPTAFLLHTCSRGYCWEVTDAAGETIAWSYLPYDTVKAAFKGIAIVRRLAREAYLVRPGDPRQPTTKPRAVRARSETQATLVDRERIQKWVERANAELQRREAS